MDGKFFESNLFAVAGDTGRRLEVQLLDSNNMVQNTTGISLRLNANVAGQATYAEATLVDAAKGLYELDLPNGMLIAPGNWQFQWQIIGTSGEKLHSFAFMGSIGSNLSEGGSEATNFYLNVDDLKQMQEDLINGTFDSVALETNIAGKLTDLETQYAPKLTEVTEQLAQTEEQVDSLNFENGEQVTGLYNMALVPKDEPPEFKEPLIKITDTTNDTKKHVAFPTMAIDGDKVLVLYRRGAKHISQGSQDNGYLVQKISSDGGVTWGNETTVVPSTPNLDPRDPNIFQVSVNELLLIFPNVGLNPDGTINGVENEVWRSLDFGTTWAKVGNLPKKANGSYYHIVRGSITKSVSGEIIVPVWTANLQDGGKTGVPYIVSSTNNGVSWTVGNDISNAPATETTIEFDGFNRLWAVMRNDVNTQIQRTRNMLIAYSDDNGVTWSDSVQLPLRGHAPHLMRLDNNELLLTYRNTDKYMTNSSQDRYSVNYCKLKNGTLSSRVHTVLDSQSPDIGYSWSVKNSTTVFMTFYVFATTFGVMYLKKIDLAKLSKSTLVKPQVKLYQNFAGYVSEISKYRELNGDVYVQGTGTNTASKFIPLPETAKSIRNVTVTLIDPNLNFLSGVSGLTTTGFTVNIKNVNGMFSSQVQVFYRVDYELN